MPNNDDLTIVGIDPGYEKLGIAIIKKTKSLNTLIYSGCIQTNKKDPHSKRLLDIQKEVLAVIKKHKPQEASIEKLFFNTNQKTGLSVAEARGVVIAQLASQDIEISEYTPLQIKIAVTGHGRSDKKQVIEMVGRLIKISKKIAQDDEYDAIACALTHSASRLWKS